MNHKQYKKLKKELEAKNPKPTKWEDEWQEFYGLYGDIGRSEEDIKHFIRQLLEAQKLETERLLPKKYGGLPEKLERITERDMLASRMGHNACLDEIIKRLTP